jgi:hypothetical protein
MLEQKVLKGPFCLLKDFRTEDSIFCCKPKTEIKRQKETKRKKMEDFS